MSSNKHAITAAELEKAYEENDVRLKSIVWFGAGLFFLIVITFGLMWYFLKMMKEFAKETADPVSPMAMNEIDRLPPEPRLQAAPGFGVDGPKGRINLELAIPQAEYREMKKIWDEQLENGVVDQKTGQVVVLPIEKGIEKVMAGGLKAKSGEEAEKYAMNSTKFVSDASAGRIASETRR